MTYKKSNPGVWANCITLVLAVISLIIYFVNVNGDGYFKGATSSTFVKFAIAVIVLLAVNVVVSFVNANGVAGKLILLVADVAKIAAPAITIAGLMYLVSARVEGFAFIYFSNPEVLQEVQTSANLSSAHGAIANLVALAITAVVGIVSAFFSLKKEA